MQDCDKNAADSENDSLGEKQHLNEAKQSSNHIEEGVKLKSEENPQFKRQYCLSPTTARLIELPFPSFLSL